MSKKKALLWASIVAGVLFLMGCTTAQTQAPANGGNDTSEPAGATQEVLHIDDWKDKYPDIYASMMRGLDVKKEKDGLSHSHMALFDTLTERIPTMDTQAFGCASCKTADLNALYKEHGDELFGMDYASNSEGIVEFWGCYSCHGNDPEGEVGAFQVGWVTLAGEEYVSSLAPADAACGQCHNYLDNYPRSIIIDTGTALADFDPYRYGTDADAIMRASLEDGDVLLTDEDGVEYLYVEGHADVEMFQGSTMQKLGLTCAGCHMPTETDASGEEYIAHDASGSPLQSEAALDFCLTCHKAKGIEDREAMVTFVKGKQSEQKAIYDEVTVLLEELHTLIVAGTDDPKIDEQAREYYLKAQWYQGFSNSAANVHGTKAPHDFAETMGYFEDAVVAAEAGIALYNK